jgi:putative transposase
MPSRRPPRIPGFRYLGPHRYHVILNTHRRVEHLSSHDTVAMLLETLRECVETFGFDVLAYSVMPEHFHVVLEGRTDTSDLVRCVHSLKQRTGFAFRRDTQQPLWQRGWFDHVLRSHEDTLDVCRYVLANPVRAGLAASPGAWPHSGSWRFSMFELLEGITSRRQPTG